LLSEEPAILFQTKPRANTNGDGSNDDDEKDNTAAVALSGFFLVLDRVLELQSEEKWYDV